MGPLIETGKNVPGEDGPPQEHSEAGPAMIGPETVTFSAVVTSMFFVVGLVVMLNHEMWADEVHAWLVAVKSQSLGELLQNCKTYGHPPLWNVCVYILTRISESSRVMQLFQLLTATTATYVFVRYSSFSRLNKILFVFGYFPFFEYAIISRAYAIGLLSVFSFCALYPLRGRTYVPLAAALALMANTSVFGIMLAITFSALLIVDGLSGRSRMSPNGSQKLDTAIAVGLVVAATALATAYMIPPPGAGFPAPWKTDFDALKLGKVLSTVWNSHFPVPNPATVHFWGSNAFDYFYPDYLYWVGPVHVMLSVSVLILAFLYFARTPMILFCYVMGTCGMLVFLYAKYFGYIRHHGHLFILLMACLWLCENYERVELPIRGLSSIGKWLESHRRTLLSILLSAHLVAAAYTVGMEMVYPFSGAKAVEQFVRRNGLEDAVQACHPDWLCVSFAHALGKELFYPNADRVGSYLIYDSKRKHGVGCGKMLERLHGFMEGREENIVLISAGKLDCARKGLDVSLVATVRTNSIVPGDRVYFLYRLRLCRE
ncbi:hypothetical protein ACFL2Q_01295 [Thermodesulfobacteriota bacterium]